MGFIADIFTASKAADAQKDASRDAAKASQYGTDQTVALQRDIFNRIWNGTQVQRDAGDAATRLMAQIMGLSLPQPGAQPNGQPQTLPAQGAPNALAGPVNKLMTEPAYQLSADGVMTPDAMYGRGNALTGGALPQPAAGGPAAPAPAPAQPFDATAWLRSTPGYQANFDAGQRSMNASLAARGGLLSGEAGREAMRYGADYNDRIFGDQFNRLAAIAGAGQTAQSQGGQAGQNYANQSGNALMQNAQNLSSSYYNRGNAISGFWGNVNGSIQNTTNQIGRAMMGGF